MLLKGKNAIIYGAGGSIGGAVARALAQEGAKVFLTGRTAEKLKAVEKDIIANGGNAETAMVDALDEKQVNDFTKTIAEKEGSLDISFNAIGLEDIQDKPITEMELTDFIRPIEIAMKTQFITCSAAGRIMENQRSGVIIAITATPAGMAYPLVGGFGPACSAIEGFSRNLAAELGPKGVRVVGIRSAGSPDSRVFREALEWLGKPAEEAIQKLADDTMLKKQPLMKEIANVAIFLASDRSSALTGTFVNATCGTTRD